MGDSYFLQGEAWKVQAHHPPHYWSEESSLERQVTVKMIWLRLQSKTTACPNECCVFVTRLLWSGAFQTSSSTKSSDSLSVLRLLFFISPGAMQTVVASVLNRKKWSHDYVHNPSSKLLVDLYHTNNPKKVWSFS